MIVCLCNRLNEQNVLCCGAKTAEQVYKAHDVVPVCGTCTETIELMLDEKENQPSR